MDNQIHFDTETLALCERAKILSIGAVCGTETFYAEIDQSSYQTHQFVADESTMKWWADRGGFQPTQELEPVGVALARFAVWVDQQWCEDTTIWCNSPQFDIQKVRWHFEVLSIGCPWDFWDERDVRTMKHLSRDLNLSCKTKLDNPHNALRDAINQRDMVSSIYQTLARDVSLARAAMYGATALNPASEVTIQVPDKLVE